MGKAERLVVAISGPSGAIYGIRLLEVLREVANIAVRDLTRTVQCRLAAFRTEHPTTVKRESLVKTLTRIRGAIARLIEAYHGLARAIRRSPPARTRGVKRADPRGTLHHPRLGGQPPPGRRASGAARSAVDISAFSDTYGTAGRQGHGR